MPGNHFNLESTVTLSQFAEPNCILESPIAESANWKLNLAESSRVAGTKRLNGFAVLIRCQGLTAMCCEFCPNWHKFLDAN